MTTAFGTLAPVFLLCGPGLLPCWREIVPLVATIATLQTALSFIAIPLLVRPAPSFK